MKQRLVVAHFPLENRDSLMTVLYEDGRAVEMYLSDPGRSSILGNVYTGMVEQVQRNSGGAFVRLTEELRGYLPLRDGLKAGMVIPVQVEKEAIKTKLPRLTENIRLTGRFLVLSSAWKGVNISSKLSSSEKIHVKQTFLEAAAEDNRTWDTLPYGVILRTNAAGCTAGELREEYDRLAARMDDILLKGRTRTGFSCIGNGDPVWLQLLRQIRPENCERIVTDDPAVFHDLSQQSDRAGLYQDGMVELYRLYNLSTRFAEATARKVWLKSGGFLVIEQTEAFVCIDVNSGRYNGKKSAGETALLINREAAEEAARQIRLRQLSGTILIDFINMEEERDREDLMKYMRELVRSDHAGVKVVDMTPLGIMELTRQKKSCSLQEQIRRQTDDSI